MLLSICVRCRAAAEKLCVYVRVIIKLNSSPSAYSFALWRYDNSPSGKWSKSLNLRKIMSYIFFGGIFRRLKACELCSGALVKIIIIHRFFFPRYSFDSECACDSIFRTFRCSSVSGAGEEREIFRVFSIRFSPPYSLSLCHPLLACPSTFRISFLSVRRPHFFFVLLRSLWLTSRQPFRNYDWVISNSSSWTRIGRSYLHTQFFRQFSTELSSRHKEMSSALSIIFNWIFRSYQDGDNRLARRWRWRVASNFFYGVYLISSSGPRLN